METIDQAGRAFGEIERIDSSETDDLHESKRRTARRARTVFQNRGAGNSRCARRSRFAAWPPPIAGRRQSGRPQRSRINHRAIRNGGHSAIAHWYWGGATRWLG